MPTRREHRTFLKPVVADGNVDFLAVTEFVRAKYGISAPVSDYGADAAQGHVSFAGPGYAAAVVFDVATSTYTVDIEQQASSPCSTTCTRAAARAARGSG